MSKKTEGVAKKAVLSTLYTLVGDYAVYGVNFVRGIILARLLVPEMYGVLRLAEFFRGIFGQPKNIGFDQALIHQQEDLERAYNGHFVLNIVSVGLSFLFAAALTPVLLHFYDQDVVVVMWILLGVLLLQAMYSTSSTLLRKNFAFRKLSIANVVASVAAFGVSVYMATEGYGLWSLVAISVTFELTKFVLIFYFAGWRPGRSIDWNLNKKMLKFGGTLWVGGLFSFIVLQFDDFLVGQLAGLVELGYYAKAYSLAQQPLGLFSQVVNKVAGPVITEFQNNQEKLEHGYNLVVGFVYKGTVYIGMVLFVWAPEIIELLIGEKWLPMVPMFRGLIFYLIAQPIWEITGSLITFTGKPGLLAKGQAVQAVLLVIFGSIGVYLSGGLGAAIAVSSVLTLTLLWYLVRYVQSSIKIYWEDVFLIPTVSILVSGFVSDWLLLQLTNQVLFWVGVIILPAVLYLLLLFVFQGRSIIRDIRFILSVVNRRDG